MKSQVGKRKTNNKRGRKEEQEGEEVKRTAHSLPFSSLYYEAPNREERATEQEGEKGRKRGEREGEQGSKGRLAHQVQRDETRRVRWDVAFVNARLGNGRLWCVPGNGDAEEAAVLRQPGDCRG
ncbi:hypothetical protein E2C01_093348 [Portunus trituberculatus]|uniref:Uncharacterized protein n=1 Tax=Portunus trituberculatus TaxID=210409 RepID=A0A5B7JT58_PORTR|nr:hypothetical protein [Portunus trituberculatus]